MIDVKSLSEEVWSSWESSLEAIATALGVSVPKPIPGARRTGRTTLMKFHVLRHILWKKPKDVRIVAENFSWAEKVAHEVLCDLAKLGVEPGSVKVVALSATTHGHISGGDESSVFYDHTHFEGEIRRLRQEIARLQTRLVEHDYQGAHHRRWR